MSEAAPRGERLTAGTLLAYGALGLPLAARLLDTVTDPLIGELSDRTWVVHFDDWLLLQPGEVVINRAQVTKLGIRVGEMVAFFAKVGEGEAGGVGW